MKILTFTVRSSIYVYNTETQIIITVSSPKFTYDGSFVKATAHEIGSKYRRGFTVVEAPGQSKCRDSCE
jgi:hypothetical protein